MEPMKHIVELEFSEVLKECSQSARRAYNETLVYQKQLRTLLENLYQQLVQRTESIYCDKDAQNFDFANALNEIIQKIGVQAQVGLLDLNSSLSRKKKTLDTFTISLFGRTKAGKSTIREALTKGNGQTIGKGAQRTTRDILEYEWKGLRLIDVPGVEAFKGDEDTVKARDIIDQSDMIVFLITDDSVQPGEFDEMAQLQEINKHFFVVMNVKNNLLDPDSEEPDFKKINRFLRKPERVFDMDRLGEHRKHIVSYVKKNFGMSFVDITWIHAQAAYLSTQQNLADYSEELWKLSQLETVYQRIVNEINRNGKHRRVLTFYDSTIHFVDTMEKMLWNEHRLIKAQANFMIEKRNELKNFFDQFIPESNRKIEDYAEMLYAPVKQWIPSFVEEYIGRIDAQEVLEKYLNSRKKNIEKSMEILLHEIVDELHNYLTEFTRQYQYDLGAINIEADNIGELKKGQVSKILKWGGVALGGISTTAFIVASAGWGAANFWNPVGWIALGASAAVGLLSWVFGESESKKWKEAKKDAKKILLDNIEVLERKTKGAYKSWFYDHITTKGKREMLGQVSSYVDGLFQIADQLRNSALEIERLKDELNKKMFVNLLQLEGVPCKLNDIKSIAREQGSLTKIIVPAHWYMDGTIKSGLDRLCGEPVSLISEELDIRKLVAKALYPGEVGPDNIKIIVNGENSIARVQVPNSKKGLFIGKKGVNIKLAQKLCKLKIELV